MATITVYSKQSKEKLTEFEIDDQLIEQIKKIKKPDEKLETAIARILEEQMEKEIESGV